MKVSIKASERDTILGQLRKKGKWTARRAGVQIRIWTRCEPPATRICYQIFPKQHVTVHGVVSTVSAAIEACNDVLHPVPRPSPSPEPQPMLNVALAAQGRQEWLPYKDN